MIEEGSHANQATATRRLDPFLLPTGTSIRFALLIILVLSAGLLVFQSLFNAASRDEFRALALACGFDKTCWQPYELRQAAVMALGTLGILFAGAALYWLVPRWKMRREHLSQITREDDAALFDDLQRLSDEMRLSRAPAFVLNPLEGRISGQAFGHVGRHYIMLTGGLATLFHTNPPAFRAVLLHELAHLKNNDVDRAYFALSVTPAFFALAFAPFLFSLLAEADAGFAFDVFWRGVALALLIYLTCAAILRVREYYADSRAAMAEGDAAGITQMIERMPQSTQRGWQRWRMTHPQPHERLSALNAPQRLMRINVLETAGMGLAIGAAIANVAAWLALALPAAMELLAYPLSALLFGTLLAILLGTGVWRAAFARMASGGAPFQIIVAAVSVGLGLFAGRFLMFRPVSAPIMPAVEAGLAALYVLGMLVFVVWLWACAALWLKVVRSRRGLKVAMAGLLTAAAILLAALMGIAFLITDNFAPLMDAPEQVFEAFVAVVDRLNLRLPLLLIVLLSLAAPVVFWKPADAVAQDWSDAKTVR